MFSSSEKATVHDKMRMERVFISFFLQNDCTEKSTTSRPTLHRKDASLLDRLLEDMYALVSKLFQGKTVKMWLAQS